MWMWRLNLHHGAVMEPEEYVDSVHLCLGCAGPCEPVPCAANWQTGSLDTGAAQPTCCAMGESTRGHNAVTAAAQFCDCTADMEVPGLTPGTDLRPADVLTSALGNSYTALDISICSPHAQQAGADCTQTAKLAYYGPHLPSLLPQNTSYTPIVWSACGRPHRDTLTVLRSLSKSIARKRNFVSAETSRQYHPGNLETQRSASSGLLAPSSCRGPSPSCWFLVSVVLVSLLLLARCCS